MTHSTGQSSCCGLHILFSEPVLHSRGTCSSLFLKGDFVPPRGYWDDPDGALLPTPQSGPCKVPLPFGYN